MRTTVTLSPRADAHVRQLMRERGLSFKDAINAAILAGSQVKDEQEFATPSFDLGRALVPLDKAIALAGDLEDVALIRRTELGE